MIQLNSLSVIFAHSFDAITASALIQENSIQVYSDSTSATYHYFTKPILHWKLGIIFLLKL